MIVLYVHHSRRDSTNYYGGSNDISIVLCHVANPSLFSLAFVSQIQRGTTHTAPATICCDGTHQWCANSCRGSRRVRYCVCRRSTNLVSRSSEVVSLSSRHFSCVFKAGKKLTNPWPIPPCHEFAMFWHSFSCCCPYLRQGSGRLCMTRSSSLTFNNSKTGDRIY